MRPFRWPIRILSPKAKYTPVNVHKTVSLLVRLHRSSAGHERDHTSISLQANRPGHWSQSFSRSYGSNLPTSLTYIILSTRGFSPWRPAADIGTIWYEIYMSPPAFQGPSRAHETPHRPRCFTETTSLSSAEPSPGSPFLNQRRKLWLGLNSASPSSFALPHLTTIAGCVSPYPGT